MAKTKVGVDQDYQKVNRLIGALIEEVTDSNKAAVLTALSQFAYNVTQKRINSFDGTAIRKLLQDNDISTDTNFTNDTGSITDRATIRTFVLAQIVGLLDFKGSYNADTNSPDLDSSPIAGIQKGDAYVVSVDGSFFAEEVEAGDFLISTQDSPTTLAHWVRIQFNLDLATVLADFAKRFASAINIDQFDIVTVTVSTKTIIVVGDATGLLSSGDKFDIEDSVDNDAVFTVDTTPVFSSPNTTIVTIEAPSSNSGVDGQINVFADIVHSVGSGDIVSEVQNSGGQTVGVDKEKISSTTVRVRSNVAVLGGRFIVIGK